MAERMLLGYRMVPVYNAPIGGIMRVSILYCWFTKKKIMGAHGNGVYMSLDAYKVLMDDKEVKKLIKEKCNATQLVNK